MCMDQLKGKNILVSGGLGFIGSNLVIKLVDIGANVTVIDSLVPDCGGNPFNIVNVKDKIELIIDDMNNQELVNNLIRDKEIVFNIAGHISHIDSMNFPKKDLDINCSAHLSLLEACKKHNQQAKIIFLGTRQIYGKIQYLPVDEKHPVNPTDVNGINKYAGELYHELYYRVYGIRTVTLRLTNTYGPRQLIKHNKQGFVGWFINRIITGEEIKIFGDGNQIRDFSYVDDVVEAMILCSINENACGQVYNLGGIEHVSLKDFVDLLVKVSKTGKYTLIPFPPEKKKIDIGDFYADYSKILNQIGWKPKTKLKDGLIKTLNYYNEFKDHYLD